MTVTTTGVQRRSFAGTRCVYRDQYCSRRMKTHYHPVAFAVYQPRADKVKPTTSSASTDASEWTPFSFPNPHRPSPQTRYTCLRETGLRAACLRLFRCFGSLGDPVTIWSAFTGQMPAAVGVERCCDIDNRENSNRDGAGSLKALAENDSRKNWITSATSSDHNWRSVSRWPTKMATSPTTASTRT